MTEDKINEWKAKIDKMSHYDMAHLYRFSPSGHPVFDSSLPLWDYFSKRFSEFGGMTSEISKAVGW